MKDNIKLGWSERLGYGAGGVGLSMVFLMIGAYLTVYLTNVAMLDIAVISTVIAVSKLLDGISDLVIGNVIDRTVSKLGKGRIWLLRMCIPFAISALLLFMVPAGIPAAAKYVYVFLLYNITVTLLVTFLQISHYSLISLITRDNNERGLLGNIQSIGRFIGMLAGTSVFVKLLLHFSGGSEATQKGYTYAVGTFCLIMVVLTLITVFTTKERVSEETVKSEGSKAGPIRTAAELRALMLNRYWLIMVVSSILFSICIQLMMSGSAYYAIYVLKDMGQVSWMMGAVTIAGLAVQLVTPFLISKLGQKKIMMIGLVMFILGSAGFGIAASSKAAMIVFTAMRGIGNGLYSSMLFGLLAAVIAFTEKKTGILAAGAGNAGISAADKLGQGIGNAMLGFVMAATGFNAALDAKGVAQPAAVPVAINWLFIWLPMIVTIAIFVVFVLFFDIDKKIDADEQADNEIENQ